MADLRYSVSSLSRGQADIVHPNTLPHPPNHVDSINYLVWPEDSRLTETLIRGDVPWA